MKAEWNVPDKRPIEILSHYHPKAKDFADDHFAGVGKMVNVGFGKLREVDDIILTPSL